MRNTIQCAACRRNVDVRGLFKAKTAVFAEGYPSGRWGRFEKGSFLCTVHAVQDAIGAPAYKPPLRVIDVQRALGLDYARASMLLSKDAENKSIAGRR